MIVQYRTKIDTAFERPPMWRLGTWRSTVNRIFVPERQQCRRNLLRTRTLSATEAAQGAQEVSAPVPTMPPRKPGVTDGEWDRQDIEAVSEALKDAAKISREFHKYGSGEFACEL